MLVFRRKRAADRVVSLLLVLQDIVDIFFCAMVNVFITGLKGSLEDSEVRECHGAHMSSTGFERRNHFIHGKRNRTLRLIIFLFIANGYGKP
ncbi:hypothetical protein D3C73_1362360 [compost metagenome]